MTYGKITSAANPRVKGVVRLRGRGRRTETGLTVVEGRREVARALESGVRFKELYVCRPLFEASGAGECVKKAGALKTPVYETAEAVFAKMSYGDCRDGILGVCAPAPLTLSDLKHRENSLFVVVEGVEKPGNLGAILRACDGAGVDGAIICGRGTDLYNPNVIRASLGAVFSVKAAASSNEAALDFLRAGNVTVCAALPQAKTVYTKAKLTGALAVAVGSEQSGLTGFWARHADLKVKIPMRGLADSLNVSAAAAVLLYEIVRQRSCENYKSQTPNPKQYTIPK